MHRHAHDNEPYQLQFAVESLPFCTGCHAPEADPVQPSDALTSLGVGCVSCHVVGNEILARGRGGPHETLPLSSMGAGAVCNSCHEFPFPDASFVENRHALMQSTVSEHRASRLSDTDCATCHMPQVGIGAKRHRDHRFAASRSPGILERAIEVDGPTFDGERWTLRLRARRVGHAFPTGDMFRQLTLRVEVVDARDHVVQGWHRVLKRHFGFRQRPNSTPRLIETRDDRLGTPGAPDAIVVVPDMLPPGGRIRHRLTYDRVADPRIPSESRYHGRITLHDGELPIGGPSSTTASEVRASSETSPSRSW